LSASKDPSKSNTSANASLPVLPTPSASQNKGSLSNLPQPQQNEGSRSMDVFPRELLFNPEYRSLLDTASRHIRLLSNKKKQEEQQGTDIPSVTSIPPSYRYSRDSDFDSGSDWEYEVATGSPGSLGSDKDYLKNPPKDIKEK